MEDWNANLDVGHAGADEAHRTLYALTVQAAEAVEREDVPAASAHLASLHEGSRAHFAAEEALMKESAFAGAKEHRQAHAAFMAEFDKLRAELGARGFSPLFRLWFGGRFVEWLRFHIRGQDAQFYRHVRLWQEVQAKEAEAKLIASAASAAPDPKAGPAKKP
jgi:hemerythrin